MSVGASHGSPDPYRPFRPRAARWVAGGLATVVPLAMLLLLYLLAVQVPGWQGWPDRLGMMAFACLVSWVLVRHATVRADPDPDGLVVRNLVRTRRVAWAHVVSVRFGGGRPWVQLDLADGTVHPVMAIQQADGAFAVAESRRLARLVAEHSRTARDD